MKVVEKVLVEDCFDGSYIKNFILDEKLKEDFILKLRSIGELKYYPEFPRPYFQLLKKNCYLIKGVIDNNYFQVIVFDKTMNLEQLVIRDLQLVEADFS